MARHIQGALIPWFNLGSRDQGRAKKEMTTEDAFLEFISKRIWSYFIFEDCNFIKIYGDCVYGD